ncbi:MAG: 16S rRNA (guanine(527)-N(7))-methyltransferase RsmG [Pirellulales bacterium]
MSSDPEIVESAPGSPDLPTALAAQGISLPDEQTATLDRYCRALWDWNTKLNLTRHTTYDRFVSRDLVDSLWLEKFLDPNQRILDVGTGGGVPGVVLAILRPDLQVELCDSVAKKARTVREIVSTVGLDVPVHHGSVQEILAGHEYETLVCRAVAPLTKLLFWLQPYWENIRQMLVIKGPNWTVEQDEAKEKKQLRFVEIQKLASYPLAGTESESVVLRIRRA